MNSIFAPRYNKTVTKDGLVKFTDRVIKGKKDFDKYYIDYKVKKIVKPLPGGKEDDYILESKVVEVRKDIRQLIQSQSDEVGLDNMLKKFAMSGDLSTLPPQMNNGEIQDITNLPQDNAEYFVYIHKLAAEYESLPADLRKDMTLDQFVKSMTDDQIKAYLDSKKPVEKVEVNKDE